MKHRGTATVPVLAKIAIVAVMIVVGTGLFLSMNARTGCHISPRTITHNNLKFIALGAAAADSLHGRLPPAFGRYGKDPDHLGDTAVFVHLLPYVEANALYLAGLAEAKKGNVYAMHSPEDESSPENVEGHCSFAGNLRVFADCASATPALNAVNWNGAGPDAFFNRLSLSVLSSKMDGASNTAMFATRYAVCNGVHQNIAASPTVPEGAFFGAAAYSAPPAWRVDGNTPAYLLAPKRTDCDATPSYFAHGLTRGPLSIVLCDASIKRISRSVSPASWANLLFPNDGNVLGPDVFE